MIHDSFGVVAPETDIMSKAIREAFCHIYQDDVLECIGIIGAMDYYMPSCEPKNLSWITNNFFTEK